MEDAVISEAPTNRIGVYTAGNVFCNMCLHSDELKFIKARGLIQSSLPPAVINSLLSLGRYINMDILKDFKDCNGKK